MNLKQLFLSPCIVIICLLFATMAGESSFAQTVPIHQQSTEQIQYQAISLSDTLTKTGIVGKSYIIPETTAPITLQTIEQMVKSGNIHRNITFTDFIRLNQNELGTWLIMPIINNSTKETWSLDLGEFSDGRFSTLKEIIIYDMTAKSYIINTQNINERNHNIGTIIPITIPQSQTRFFIIYLKSASSSPNYLSPNIVSPSQSNATSFFGGWILPFLTFGAFIFFLKLANDSRNFSSLFMALAWLSCSIPLFISTNYVYVGKLDMEMFYPLAWLLSALFFLIGFLSVKEGRNEISLSVTGGIASAIFMTGLIGIIILKSLPSISLMLVYGATAAAYIVILTLVWGKTLEGMRTAYLHISNTVFFLFLTLAYIVLLNLNFTPINQITVFVPQVILCFAICLSIYYASLQTSSTFNSSYNTENPFAESRVEKREAALIKGAKEQSEHHRLMQVIEQERKVMSELQVRSAKQTEEMRKSKEAADEANRAKSAFLAVVSHEIRTPMTGIMGMLRLLQETQLSKEQKEYSSTIKDSGDAMLALLNDILDFEKIESGKMDIENISFDLKRLIRGVHTLMRGHAEAKNVDLILETDPQLPNWIFGDPTRLRQVLLNLINNAIKFTNKGQVYLRVRDLTGEGEALSGKTHQIYFAVQDSGIGIGTDAQKGLFMPFAQADSSINRKYGGTGLGLAICKRLIEAMGGAISISSKEGEGSTFFFTVSMDEGTEIYDDNAELDSQIEHAHQQKTELGKSLSVLIVDDNGINQKVVSGFVSKLGGRSMTAGTGADALDQLAMHQFDLMLLDIELPDMNGLEVTRIIRQLSVPTKANIPIIALTGNIKDDDIKAYLKAGMNDFAAKPVTFEKIYELLKKTESGEYLVRKNIPIEIDFSDNMDGDHINIKDDNINEISPLLAYTSQLKATSPSFETIREEEYDEDSFSMAVKKFEDLEQGDNNNSTGEDFDDLTSSGLDKNILTSLKSGLPLDQIQEILVSFYEKADELIADIGMAYINGDMIRLNARAHELKGMAGNFGFAEVSQMCSIIEKAGKDNTPDIAKDQIQRLGEHYAMARGHLNKWLSQS